MLNIKETRDENKKLHSHEDEPTIITRYGNKEWYCHGKLHREDGPAVIENNGDKYWYCHGKLHREDGPAVIENNGDKYWYINGDEYDFHDWIKLVSLPEEQKAELLLSN